MGKTASCAAMALTVAAYAAPTGNRLTNTGIAVTVVAALTALNYRGVQKSAWTLRPNQGRPRRIVLAVGLAGCLILTFSVPPTSVITGVAVLAIGTILWAARRTVRRWGRRYES